MKGCLFYVLASSHNVKISEQAQAKAMTDDNYNDVDTALKVLESKKREWVLLSFAKRVAMLKTVRKNLTKHGMEWARAAIRARGHDIDHDNYDDLLGEEYLANICAQTKNINFYLESLEPMAAQESMKQIVSVPKPYGGTSTSVDSKATMCQVFPGNKADKLLWYGVTADVWVDKIDGSNEIKQGTRLLDTNFEGAIALVLGAGNVNSIAGGDVLYKLLNENEVVMLKWNPVNDYSEKFMRTIYAPFYEMGVLQSVSGDHKIGKYLASHPLVSNVHMTGSAHTFDQIVWGPGSAGEIAANKKKGKKSVSKPVTAELGCVSPMIIVPGHWSDAEIDYIANHLVGTVLNNNSYNCVAGKVLVVDENWAQREQFFTALERNIEIIPTRNPYYPGSVDRYNQLKKDYGDRFRTLNQPCKSDKHLKTGLVRGIRSADVTSEEPALCYEAWSPFLAELIVKTDGSVTDFLAKSTDACNNKLWGTLSCSIYVDPRTQAMNSVALEQSIADLKYGSIGVNCWPALVFTLLCCAWGAAPIHTPENIQSGIGFVHNSLFLENIQKSVLRTPFMMPVAIKLPYHPRFKNVLSYSLTLQKYEAQGGFFNALKFLCANACG